MRAKSEPPTMLQVSTLLDDEEQLRVDAAGTGLFEAHHRETVNDVLHDLRRNSSRAILVSVDYWIDHRENDIRRLVREFSEVPTIALIRRKEPRTMNALLALGEAGIRNAIDLEQAQPWKTLRSALVQQCGDRVERLLLQHIQQAMRSSNVTGVNFFHDLIQSSRYSSSVRALAEELGMLPSTLMSRFFRAGLPAPKRYITWIRLIRAAFLLENQGLSIANVANHLEYSSPQSFGRHIRCTTGLTALEFRRRYSGRALIRKFRDQLLDPYQQILACFDPLGTAKAQYDRTRERVHSTVS